MVEQLRELRETCALGTGEGADGRVSRVTSPAGTLPGSVVGNSPNSVPWVLMEASFHGVID